MFLWHSVCVWYRQLPHGLGKYRVSNGSTFFTTTVCWFDLRLHIFVGVVFFAWQTVQLWAGLTVLSGFPYHWACESWPSKQPSHCLLLRPRLAVALVVSCVVASCVLLTPFRLALLTDSVRPAKIFRYVQPLTRSSLKLGRRKGIGIVLEKRKISWEKKREATVEAVAAVVR